MLFKASLKRCREQDYCIGRRLYQVTTAFENVSQRKTKTLILNKSHNFKIDLFVVVLLSHLPFFSCQPQGGMSQV